MLKASYRDILDSYNKVSALPPKERFKKIRSVAALAKEALKNATDINELKLYAKIFKMVDDPRLLNKAKCKEYELKGITEIKPLKTKLGSTQIESGLIAVGDPSLGYTGTYDTEDIIQKMARHDFYCVGTGGDGTFDITLRVVEIAEPLIGPKEYRFIENNSKISTIKISSGRVKCADLKDINTNEAGGLSYDLENGYYNVCFYFKIIPERYFGFVVVLAKTDTPQDQQLTEIEDLG